MDQLEVEYRSVTEKLQRGPTKGQGAEGLENRRAQLARRLMAAGRMPRLKKKYLEGKRLKSARKTK